MSVRSRNAVLVDDQPPPPLLPPATWISLLSAAVFTAATVIVFVFTNFETKEHSIERVAVISGQISDLKQQIDKDDNKRDEQFRKLTEKLDSIRSRQ